MRNGGLRKLDGMSRRHIDPYAIAQSSAEYRRLNPHLIGSETLQKPQPDVLTAKTVKTSGTRKGKHRREMNKLEGAFSRLLQARRHRGEIVSFEYEGLTLRWGDGMRYTCDFKIVTSISAPETENEGAATRVTLVEIKGAYCWKQDLVKYRAAAQHEPWRRVYRFEWWEQIDRVWQQVR